MIQKYTQLLINFIKYIFEKLKEFYSIFKSIELLFSILLFITANKKIPNMI